MKKNINLVLFDFDGVLCSDYFYFTLGEYQPDKYQAINEQIFSSPDRKEFVESWMRGQIDHHAFNADIAQVLDIDAVILDRELEQSIKQMNINKALLNFSNILRERGVKTSIFTDNMDVFEKFTVPHHSLFNYFDNYYSSHSHHMLKNDNNWEFLRYVIDQNNASYDTTLLIDDSRSIGKVMTDRGGSFYLYPRGGQESDYNQFYDWFSQNYFTIGPNRLTP